MTIITVRNGRIYPHSIVELDTTTFCLVKRNGRQQLAIKGDTSGFTNGEQVDDIHLFPLTAANAQALRGRLDWLKPVTTGLHTSFGYGDRLGLATPGHVAAHRAAGAAGQIIPIFAQQSVRENARTGRSPQAVLDDAMWGVFQAGWREPWAADADHLKDTSDVAPFVQAGYTFFTIDPGDHVDSAADSDPLDTLREKAADLPWPIPWPAALGDYRALLALVTAYRSEPATLGDLTLAFDEETILRALVKYGRALWQTAIISREIAEQMGGHPFDLEMSIDETDTPTTLHEHYFIANELRRAQIPVNSLAPRFPGKFQKGVDYIGDPQAFAANFARHAQIMRHFGSYKLSIHTGSDKFSLYEAIARETEGRAHVKTAGTSYLEALRVLAAREPALFHEILAVARESFTKDRHSYFLDCQLENVPAGEQLTDGDLPALLDQFDARQLLHVTFGSVLQRFADRIRPLLSDPYAAAYESGLVAHFGRHLQPFV
jgi:hypothetical protein